MKCPVAGRALSCLSLVKDLALLRLERPESPEPPWVVGHVTYDHGGPIVAVIWWEEEGQESGFLVDEDGLVSDDKVFLDASWCYWIVGDGSPSIDDPRTLAPNVFALSDDSSPGQALELLSKVLEEIDPPTFTRAEPERALSSLWRVIPSESTQE